MRRYKLLTNSYLIHMSFFFLSGQKRKEISVTVVLRICDEVGKNIHENPMNGRKSWGILMNAYFVLESSYEFREFISRSWSSPLWILTRIFKDSIINSQERVNNSEELLMNLNSSRTKSEFFKKFMEGNRVLPKFILEDREWRVA